MNKFCHKCGKPVKPSPHKSCPKHSKMPTHPHHHDGCKEHHTCHHKPDCKSTSDNLSSRIQKLIGQEVRMKVDCGDKCDVIKAKICHVGTDFVEVHVIDKCDDSWDNHQYKERNVDHPSKHHKDSAAIFPMGSVKNFEVKHRCNCHNHDHHHDCDCCS